MQRTRGNGVIIVVNGVIIVVNGEMSFGEGRATKATPVRPLRNVRA